jgi:ABC-type methionine transport system ATPase subunit
MPANQKRIDFCGLTERDITVASQKPYIMRDTVIANLTYPLKIRGIPLNEQKISYWRVLCGSKKKKTEYARSLSSGQQQRLSLARALIFAPKLVIIDESLSNLDLDAVEAFEKEILNIQKTSPVTWIIISHQLSHVQRLCDRVHFMSKGRILKSGPVDEVLLNPQEPELIRYLKHVK